MDKERQSEIVIGTFVLLGIGMVLMAMTTCNKQDNETTRAVVEKGGTVRQWTDGFGHVHTLPVLPDDKKK